MATLSAEQTAPVAPRKAGRVNRWDSPWLNPKLIIGATMVLGVAALALVGPLFWNVTLARVASSPLNLPPVWMPGGDPAHPLGTESNGRDMLAAIITGAPRSLYVGVIAATIGIVIGVILGCTAGYMGGRFDSVIRTLSDSVITIPSLAVLIVISAYVSTIEIETMALILAMFAWPAPARIIRSQVLTLRERGYVRLARLSGAGPLEIIIKEMVPNLLPYLAASLSGAISGAILAATSLEALGLGPTRIPTLGMTIFYAIRSSAIIRGMWWWWGFPILVLVIIFTGLFLMAVGLDEVANPRLRGAN
jgi:peptide/nickel transport system permease protein